MIQMQKHKLLAFLLALVASICLWFYAVTVVNPDDSTKVSGIPIQFEGTEALAAKGLMITGGENSKVSAKISGRRSDLKELDNETLTAVADVTRISAAGEYQLTWDLAYPATVATGDIGEVSRSPSRISVTVSEVKEKPEVPVKIEYTGSMGDGFMLDEETVKVSPSELSFVGPADEVSRIDHALVRIDVSNATELIDGEYDYILVDAAGNELSLSKYITASEEKVRVTVPVLRYKDVKLTVELVPGGGATKQDTKVSIDPKTIRVTGSEEDLANMPEELSVKTINLAEMGYSQTLTVKPDLPRGITNRDKIGTVEITLELLNLTTKTVTIPTSSIERINDSENMSFAVQSFEVQLRGKQAILNSITSSDIHVIADMQNDYDEITRKVSLKIELANSSTSVGVIGGSYSLPVILESETER